MLFKTQQATAKLTTLIVSKILTINKIIHNLTQQINLTLHLKNITILKKIIKII